MGNPGAFSYSHTLWVKGFLDAIGSPHYYTAGSQDVNNRFAASALLYGTPLLVPIPDLHAHRASCSWWAPTRSSRTARCCQRPARARAAARHRARGGRSCGRPAPHRDRAPVRAPSVRPDADALAVALDAQRDLRGGAADRDFLADRTARAPASSAPGARPSRPRRPRRGPACRPRSVRRLAHDFAGPTAPPPTAGRAPASAASARWSPSCSTPSTPSPATSTAPGGAVFGSPPVALDDLGERLGLATYGKRALSLRRLPGRDRQPPRRRSCRGRSRRRASARSGRCSSPRATRCCRCRTATRSSARSASSTCASRSTSTSTRRTSTPTTCSPPPPSTSARTCRSPCSASSPRRSSR